MLELVKEIVLGKAEAGGGGSTINNEDMTITVNGTYTASEGYTGIGTATVNVPQPTGTISITTNGTADVNDYQYANVDVPQYEEKTATNKTGSAVASGDKVWVDGSDIKSFIDTTYGDFTKTGTPTITNGVASNFSTSDYIVPKCYFDNAYTVNAIWEWVVKFNIETISQFNSILGGDSGSYMLDLYVGVANKLGINLSGNGSSYNIAEGVLGTTVLSASTDYWVKFGWTGSVYYVDLSTDGKTFTREISVNSASPVTSYSYPSRPLCIGYRVSTYFHGSIDLKETSFSLKNTTEQRAYTWRAYDILIDSSFVTGVAKEAIANNASGKVGIGELGKKYGATINNFLGDVDANGKLQEPIREVELTFTGVKDLAPKSLYNLFGLYTTSNAATNKIKTVSFPDLETASGWGCLTRFAALQTGLTSISFPKLKTFSADYGLQYAFNQTGITTVSFPNLETISSLNSAMGSCFASCQSLTSISFPKLKTISNGGSAFDSGFAYCPNLTSVDFSALETVSQTYAFNNAFYGSKISSMTFDKLSSMTGMFVFKNTFTQCSMLTSLSFPALKSTSFGSYTNQFNGMLNSVTGCTVHFPSNLQAVIGSWSDVTAGFGGTNTTVLFDLPATE